MGYSSDSERHPKHQGRTGGGGDAPHPSRYPNDQSERPYANGPTTSQQRYHEKPRGGYGDHQENDYYGNSGYGSLRKHRHDERDYYGREHTQYEATARV